MSLNNFVTKEPGLTANLREEDQYKEGSIASILSADRYANLVLSLLETEIKLTGESTNESLSCLFLNRS